MIMKQSKYLILSWEDFHQDTKALATLLKGVRPWKGIMAITRGGLVPAAIIATELDIRLIETVCISSYGEDEEQKHLTVYKTQALQEDNWIAIDDLADTGATLNTVKKAAPQAFYASIYAKPAGKEAVDQYLKIIPQETWIVFPWEKPPSHS